MYQGYPGEENIRQYAAEYFVDLMESKSAGRIKTTIYIGLTLGDWTVANEMVQEGSLELCLDNHYPALDERLNAQFLNYLFFDWAGCREAFMEPGGWMNEVQEPVFTKVGFKQLGTVNPGWVGIGFKKGVHPDATNVDAWFADAAKIKIRCEPAKLMEKVAESLGFKVEVMPYSELYTALQTGVVEGWIGGTLVDSMLWLDILDYFVQARDRIDLENLFMNLELWNSLSDEDKEIVRSSAVEAQNWAWDWIEEEEKTWVGQAEAAGMEVAELAPEVMAEIVRRDHETEWPFAEQELVGKEMMDAIRAHAK
jgi:TRAP-type C4-dicarboxylate transport system substrate-binding protein